MMTETMTANKMTAKTDKMMTVKMTDPVDVRFDIMVAAMAMGRVRWHFVVAFMADCYSCWLSCWH